MMWTALAALRSLAVASTIVTCPAGANCTAILQSAIDAGGDFTVAGNFTVLPIFLRSSGQTITFAPGSSVVAQAGAFHGLGDCLFSADGVEELTIIGYGATWAMRRHDYNGSSAYNHSEWRHALSIMSSDSIVVRGLHISETGGDGVYLALVSSVELRDVTTDGAYRNGLSIISASGLVVAGCRFLNTAGTPPQAGIDIEPNHVKPGRRPERLERVVLRDIEARRNLGAGLSFSISKLTGADALDIVVDGAVIEGAAETQAGADALLYNIGVYVGGKSSPNASSPGRIRVRNVTVTDTAQPGLEVFGKMVDGAVVTLERLRLERVARSPAVRWGGLNVPVLLHESSGGDRVGGLLFDACDVKPPPLRLAVLLPNMATLPCSFLPSCLLRLLPHPGAARLLHAAQPPRCRTGGGRRGAAVSAMRFVRLERERNKHLGHFCGTKRTRLHDGPGPVAPKCEPAGDLQSKHACDGS